MFGSSSARDSKLSVSTASIPRPYSCGVLSPKQRFDVLSSTPPSGLRSSQNHWVATVCVSVGLLAAIFAIYGRASQYDFINYDDDIYVYENRLVLDGLSAEGFQWAFTTLRCGNWHPITWLSLMLDAEIYGDSRHEAGGYHLTNILLHAANTLLLFALMRRMSGAFWPSAMVAGLFAVHPVHVESVAWVTERKDVLALFFALLTMLAYVRYARRPSLVGYLMMLVPFLLALGTKSIMVTLPCVLMLLDFWPLRRISGSRFWSLAGDGGNEGANAFPGRSIVYLVFEKLPLLACSVAVGLYASHGQLTVPEENIYDTSLGFRSMNAVTSYFVYLRKMLWPSDLGMLFPMHARMILPWQAILATAGLLVVTLVAVLKRRRWPWLFVGWFWFVGVLLPVSSFFQEWYLAYSDRFLYLPAIGIYVAAVFSVTAIAVKWRIPSAGLAIAGSLVLVAYAGTAYVQLGYWQNSNTVFTRAIEVSDRNLRAYKHRAWAHQAKKQYAEAIKDYDEVLSIVPDRSMVHTNRGVANLELGNRSAALKDFDRAIELDPSRPLLFVNRGQIHEHNGDMKLALQDYDEAIRLDSDFALAYRNRGNAHLRSGNLDLAINDLSESIRLNPGRAKPYLGRGNAYLAKQYYGKAVADFEEALKRDPTLAAPHLGLARAHVELQNYRQAREEFQTAVKIDPTDVEALNEFAWFLATGRIRQHRNGRLAVQLATRACELTGHKEIGPLDTLAASHAELGEFQRAIQWQQKAIGLAAAKGRKDLEREMQLRLKGYRAGKRHRSE